MVEFCNLSYIENNLNVHHFLAAVSDCATFIIHFEGMGR